MTESREELAERDWPRHYARHTLAFYVLLSAVYIPLSGLLVAGIASSTETLMLLEVLKGWGFVAVSATALYFWTRRMIAFIETARNHYQTSLASLDQSVRNRDALLGVVAHDLRSPLNNILLQAQVVLRKAREPETAQLRQVIGAQVRRMNQLIQDLLDVSRLAGEQARPTPERLSPRELVQETEQLLAPAAREASLSLVTELATELPDLVADRAHVQRIFDNLVGNALKFTPAGGRIAVRVDVGHGEVRFAVSDTGQGIAAAELPHLFERFWQGARVDRRGVGLGLTIVKGLVEANGGRVWAESEPGKGATFFFTLPSAAGAEGPVSPPPGRARAESSLPRA
jgi:signal transduction histidine kinase